jgi:Fe2+ transport system protein FeoA
MITTLNRISAETVGIVQKITTDNVTKERLESLGLISGVEIAFIRKSPLGSIRIYKCLNTLVALRDDIAGKIVVEVPDEY